jgi:hypothetical protein
MLMKCPVDGYWEDWQAWSNCSAECGDGVRKRRRECVEPLYGGLPCPGSPLGAESCTMDPCAGRLKLLLTLHTILIINMYNN